MSFADHLRELTRRLIWSAASLVAGATAGWLLAAPLMDALREPITQVAVQQGRQASLNFDTITGAFDLRMQLALTIGIVFSSPMWLYQLWAFFVPALSKRERRYAFGFFFSAVPLFLAGTVTGWLLVPHIVELMTSFASKQDSAIVGAKAYIDFLTKTVIAVGVAFVLPVFLVLLNFVGVLSAKTIMASWRFALIVIALFAAIATPAADVFSMFLLAAPLAGLFFASTGIAALHDRRVAHATQRALVGVAE